jgi:hypothetical protein
MDARPQKWPENGKTVWWAIAELKVVDTGKVDQVSFPNFF